MEDVLQIFLKAIIIILRLLKKAVDFLLSKTEALSAKVAAKEKSKATASAKAEAPAPEAKKDAE